nr:MAG: hypothetical protein [Bacteriophage sp.]
MAKNLIPQIAKMLGVEIGEEFKIKGYNERTYRFDPDGLKVNYSFLMNKRLTFASVMLCSLLAGTVEIVKLPWQPKKGDAYFTFVLMGDKWGVDSLHWDGFPNEYALLDKGWVYRSQAEAKAALPAVAKEMGVKHEI